jgi:hypothetical protein
MATRLEEEEEEDDDGVRGRRLSRRAGRESDMMG